MGGLNEEVAASYFDMEAYEAVNAGVKIHHSPE
jgi:hypothetical protein